MDSSEGSSDDSVHTTVRSQASLDPEKSNKVDIGKKKRQEVIPSTDPRSPLYLHPSDHPGMGIITIILNGDNYSSWKRAMVIALSAKNKLGFVTGKIPKPDDIDDDNLEFEMWNRCNYMVTSWILNVIVKDIKESVLFAANAKQIWDELNARFNQSNGAQLFALQKELISISQGTGGIASYFTRIKRLWDELSNIDEPIPCTCEGRKELWKSEEKQRLIQLLMGLNDGYGAVRGHILMMDPLPTVHQAYSLLIQEERQREIHATSPVASETAAFHTSSFKPHMTTPWQHGTHASSSGNNNGSYSGRRNNLQCTHCHRGGHTVDRCYKLHGYPSASRFGRGKKFSAQVESSDSGSNEVSAAQPMLSLEHFKQMMNLYNKEQATLSASSHNASAGPMPEDSTSLW